MKRLCISLLCFFSALVMSEQPELEWCLDDFPNRHSYPSHGSPYGPTVDFMQELAKRADIRIRFSPNTPFARCLRLMEQGKTDLMTSLNTSPDRQAFMHLIPYDHARPEVLYLRHDANDVWSVSELNTLHLMVIRGYTYNAAVLNLVAEHGQTIEVDSLESGLTMLLLGRANALLAPSQSSRNLIQSNSRYHDQFKTASLKFQLSEPRYVHLGLSQKSPHAHLKQQLLDAIESMVADDLIHRYFHGAPAQPEH